MKKQAFIGLVGVVSLVLFAILQGAPLLIFFDPTGVLVCVGGTLGLLSATHGFNATLTAITDGLRGLLSHVETQDVETHEHNAHIAQTGGTLCMAMGITGTMIGLIQMFRNLDDPSQIGPAMAVALLTPFYAIMLNLLLFVPISRYHREMARTPSA